MKMTKSKSKSDRKAYALLDETRMALLTSLLERPKHISELAKNTHSGRATICYHLNILEELGLVESSYVMLQQPRLKGKVGRVYSVNRKRLEEALSIVEKKLPKLDI
jgi:DNA-binding transcriptional ArsR family regulator